MYDGVVRGSAGAFPARIVPSEIVKARSVGR